MYGCVLTISSDVSLFLPVASVTPGCVPMVFQKEKTPVLGFFPFLQLRRGLVDWATDPRVTKHRQITWQIVPIYISFFNHIPRIVAVTR